jgi:TonB-linked SusC/RagA family outer membrane protein
MNKKLRLLKTMAKYSLLGFICQLFLFTLVLASETNAQRIQSVKEVYVELGFDKTRLEEVFSSIELVTEFRFTVYEHEDYLKRLFTMEKKRMTVEQLLTLISQETGLMFQQINNNIGIKKGDRYELKRKNRVEVIIQTRSISGRVTSSEDVDGLPGVNVVEKGTTNGTITNLNGEYSINVAEGATLVFSSVGFTTEEIEIGTRTIIDLVMVPDIMQLQELVVVGYGVQKKSDITGTVASLGQERLELVPNTTIAQAIQGAIPGVMMQTSSAGAAPSEVLMVRGRNSIRASNDPLIVVDGVPYGGQLRDINPNDVQSIEVLKDASAAAIYGSRGANGVILVTTKTGLEGKPKIGYNGYYSIQQFVNLPDLMSGEEFYNFKMEREPQSITQSEREIYESGEWVDWLDLALRNGASMEHNLSVSGGFEKTQYYFSGGMTNVRGLAVNDDYTRLSTRLNLDSRIAEWITIGTRTQLTYDDRGGIAPTWDGDQGVFWMNPLTRAYDDDGNLSIYPWPEDPYFRNPLMGTLAKSMNESFQVVTNNYAILSVPFIQGLQYRINSGLRFRFLDIGTYYGRDTQRGLVNRGDASTNRSRYNNNVLENIISYNRDFGKHNLFFTGVYSFEYNRSTSNTLSATGFPHDFLTWYSASQAEKIEPDYSFSETALISQMLRLNYSFDSRYLFTITGRRDGYSGFGAENKWGIFPSVALGWNVAREAFFPWENIINELKLRASFGLNGNQAVGAYETISRLSDRNYVAGSSTLPGYIPSRLGEDNLGWESSRTFNIGLDLGLFADRITGDINYFRTNTTDLLLRRSISEVHGITSITQNIGETQNTGFEAAITSRNVASGDFRWVTNANAAYVKNQIVSLYGELDEEGKEIDDINNQWFIGKPIRVNFGYVWDGIWQLYEADQAALYGTQPGYVRIKDVDGDTLITPNDRQIVGQRDPKFMWGMNNAFSYRNFTLSVFLHGVHGVTKNNVIKSDNVYSGVRRNTTKKDWWTPENQSTTWYMNLDGAHRQGGVSPSNFEDASFVRIKDITLSYNFARGLLRSAGFDRLQLYATGRNLITMTSWEGLDPELDGQRSIPLQKEFVFGLNLGF